MFRRLRRWSREKPEEVIALQIVAGIGLVLGLLAVILLLVKHL